MPTPIIEQIAADLATTIEELSIANGYDLDLDVIRPELSDFADVVPGEGVVVLVQDGIQFAEPEGMAQRAHATFVAEIYVEPDPDNSSLDTLINTRVADVIAKILEDPQRANLAIDCSMESLTVGHTEQGFSGGSLSFSVHYRTMVDDPYTKV